jgi:type 1 glutamine amidotransferase
MLHRIFFFLAPLFASSFLAVAEGADKPMRALLITGGCYHNYPFQTQALTNAVAKLASVEWTVLTEGCSGTRAEISLYDNPDWAKGFDIVVHNECFADTTNHAYIRKITRVHKAGVPSVVIHCAMHTYRAADIDDWREFLGVTSRRHDGPARHTVKVIEPEHPILKGMPSDWTTPTDELYNIDKVWPTAKALATSVSAENGKTYPVIWINQFGNARVFGTTYGHGDDTWRDPVFLNYVSRGFMWAAGRLEP